jgi:hypothetical protein
LPQFSHKVFHSRHAVMLPNETQPKVDKPTIKHMKNRTLPNPVSLFHRRSGVLARREKAAESELSRTGEFLIARDVCLWGVAGRQGDRTGGPIHP